MLPHSLRGGKIRAQFFVTKQGMQLAMTGAVQMSARSPSLGFRAPVVSVYTFTGKHLPPADLAGTEAPGLFSVC